jgi:hypothetical protein
MSFWTISGYNYESLTVLTEDKLLLLLNAMNREDIIEWLSWNDPNGIYNDRQSLKELGNIMSRDEGLEIILRQLEENRILPS